MNLRRQILSALSEDRARRDVTARAFVPVRARGRARLVARGPGVLAGIDAARAAFERMDSALRTRILARDGARLKPGLPVLTVEGPLRAILSAERTALNFLTHLSGVATLTHRFVDAAGPAGPRVMETRKTLPGLRDLERSAVRAGGGHNHRRDLSEMILVKENHLALFRKAGGHAAFVQRVRRARAKGWVVEMECQNVEEAVWGLDSGADILLLDNIPPARLPGLVRRIKDWCGSRGRRRPVLEVSGGVTLSRMPALARAGVDRVSVGALTHSAPALDMSLDVEAL